MRNSRNHHRPRIPRTILAHTVLALAASLSLLCSTATNPFADHSNTGVVIVSASMHDGDTVDVFTTYSIQLKIAVKELVEQITVGGSNNRLWPSPDSTILQDAFANEPFTFGFSFTDTGGQTVRIDLVRTDGVTVSDTFSVFARSPLNQDTLVGLMGDSLPLLTPPVGDPDVNYLWSFGASVLFSSQLCSLRVVPATPLLAGRGGVWVSDGVYSSPADSFYFTLRDTAKPIIVCVNENYVGRDTVYTSDSVFSFKVRITDRADQWVDSASVGGEAFDDKYDRVYTKWLDRMYLYTFANPRRLPVYALDHFQHGNEAIDTFWVIFHDTIPPTVPAEILIVSPPSDTALTSASRYTVFGEVINHALDPLDLTLSLYLNGNPNPATHRITAGNTSWEWEVALDTGLSRIQVSAVDNISASVVDWAESTIRRVTNIADTIPPRILQVTIDGVAGQNLYTSRRQVEVGVEAIDVETGIGSLFINGAPLSPSSGSARWYYDTLDLEHIFSGNEIIVRAVDSSANDSSTTVVVYRNRRPVVQQRPAPSLIVSDSLYVDTIEAFDPDGDSITFDKTAGPDSLTVSNDGIIVWTPDSADTGQHSVTVRVFDGYQPVFVTYTLFVYLPGNLPPGPVRLGTTEQDFPDFLEAGRDSLNLTLGVDPQTGIPPFVYEVRASVGDRSITLVQPSGDSVLVWVPESSDTGWAQLMVTVRDGFPNGDTIYPRIFVAPPNQPCQITVRFLGDTLSNGAIDINGRQGPDTLTFHISDPDDPLTEVYDITIRQYRTQLVNHFDSARVDSIDLVIDPAAFDGYDTITVIAVDRGGNTDTLTKTVYYGMPPYSPQLLSPQNYGTVPGTSTTLSWQSSDPDADSVWYDVYLGTNAQILPLLTTTGNSSYPATGLSPSTTYYWRVVARDWKSFTTGNVWEFATQ